MKAKSVMQSFENSTSYRPRITIVIPTYNCEETLDICLRSVVDQQYDNIEVWLIDGVSEDGTVSIIKNYQKKYPFIHYISEPDRGIYDAMNKGIKLAKGEWLYFLGSDDRLYSDDIINEVFFKSVFRYDVIYGNVFNKVTNGLYDGEFTIEKLFNKNICHQAIFFKKDLFKTTGLFTLKYKALADWDHNLNWFGSSKIKKLYIDKTIAIFEAGGISSLYEDSAFRCYKNLKFIKYNRNRISFLNKLRMLKVEFIKSITDKRVSDAFYIVAKTPFLLS